MSGRLIKCTLCVVVKCNIIQSARKKHPDHFQAVDGSLWNDCLSPSEGPRSLEPERLGLMVLTLLPSEVAAS